MLKRSSFATTIAGVAHCRAPLVAGCAFALSCAHASSSPQTLTVVGTDYAFQAPDSVRAGPAVVSFVNRGTVRHELFLVQLHAGRTLADVIRATTPQERRAMIDGSGAVLFANAGETPPTRLLTELSPGRTYALLCFLRDTANALPHLSLGMAKTMHAK